MHTAKSIINTNSSECLFNSHLHVLDSVAIARLPPATHQAGRIFHIAPPQYAASVRPLYNAHTPSQVVDRIMNDVLPVIRQSGLAGHAEYVTRSPFFTEHPVAVDMLLDVLTDRRVMSSACLCVCVCVLPASVGWHSLLLSSSKARALNHPLALPASHAHSRT